MPLPPYRAHIPQSGDSGIGKEATPLPLILELGEPGSQPSLWRGLTCLNSLRFMELIFKVERGDVWTLPLEPASSLKMWEKPVHIQNTPPGGWQGVRRSGSPFPHTPMSPHSDPSEKGSPPQAIPTKLLIFPMFSEPPSLENWAPLWTSTEGTDLSDCCICCSEPLALLEKHFYSLQVKTNPQENRGLENQLHQSCTCFDFSFFPLLLSYPNQFPISPHLILVYF